MEYLISPEKLYPEMYTRVALQMICLYVFSGFLGLYRLTILCDWEEHCMSVLVGKFELILGVIWGRACIGSGLYKIVKVHRG